MKIEDGILYVFISLTTFVVNLAISSLTDTIADKEIIKIRSKKYSIFSFLIIAVYFLYYYLTSNTRVFKFTTEDGILFLLIFIFSFLYFHLNGTISTFVKKFINTIDNNKYKLNWAMLMICVNLVMMFAIVFFVQFISKGNNFLYENTVGEFKYKNTTYTISIPSETYFDYDFRKENKDDSSTTEEKNSILKTSINNSIYLLKKGSNIELKKDTYVKYINSVTSSETNNDSDASIGQFYYTNDTIMKLQSNLTVRLLSDTKVMFEQSSPYISLIAINTYFLTLILIFYYAFKLYFKRV